MGAVRRCDSLFWEPCAMYLVAACEVASMTVLRWAVGGGTDSSTAASFRVGGRQPLHYISGACRENMSSGFGLDSSRISALAARPPLLRNLQGASSGHQPTPGDWTIRLFLILVLSTWSRLLCLARSWRVFLFRRYSIRTCYCICCLLLRACSFDLDEGHAAQRGRATGRQPAVRADPVPDGS